MYSFKLGKNKDAKWWDLGIKTMKEGEKALFTVGPDYAFGKEGKESLKVPADATLTYEVELVKAHPKSKWDFSIEERQEKANEYKNIGNGYFKNNDFENAKK